MEKIIRVVGFQPGHDVSYCILENGIPVVHEELERFTREKEPLGDGLEMFFKHNPDVNDVKYFCHGNPSGDLVDGLVNVVNLNILKKCKI